MREIDMYKAQSNIQSEAQSRLQQEATEASNRVVAPQLREQISEAQAAVIAQTNPARALKVILEGIRGNMFDENGELINIGHPMMNEKGISRVASMLIPFINDPVRFGHISGTEVRSMALQIANDITEEIGLHWREYGVPDGTTKDIIIDSLTIPIFITLTRSEEGGEKKFLTQVVLESVNSNQHQTKSKGDGGWLKKFKL